MSNISSLEIKTKHLWQQIITFNIRQRPLVAVVSMTAAKEEVRWGNTEGEKVCIERRRSECTTRPTKVELRDKGSVSAIKQPKQEEALFWNLPNGGTKKAKRRENVVNK